MSVQSYPLQWPEGWARTPWEKRTDGRRFNTTFTKARDDLFHELKLLGAKSPVVSSWLPVRRDGMPYADQARRRIDDPGVAVYFQLRGRQMVMARDAFWTVHDNLRSICLGVAHLRGLERHGGGQMMERAFAGFAALAAPDTRDPFAILGLRPDAASVAGINYQFRNLAKKHHPDNGGSVEEMQKLTWARDEALKRIGGANG